MSLAYGALVTSRRPKGLGVDLKLTPSKGGGVVYDPDATALFARMTAQPTAARKKLYSDLITALKDGGVWATLDALYLFAAADNQAARLNLVQDRFNASAAASPLFSVDLGYSGDGAAAYINTNLNPVTDAALKLSQNSLAVSLWVNDANATSNQSDAGQGGTTNTVMSVRNTSSQIIVRPNAGVNVGIGTVSNSDGLTGWSRPDAANASVYKNGASLTATASASLALVSSFFTIFRASTSYSARRTAAYAIGSHRDAAKELALYNALNTFLTAIRSDLT